MAIDFGALLFESACRIVERAVSKKVSQTATNFLTKRRIQSRLEDSIAKVIEPLVPFFESEKITEENKILLLSVCERELQSITNDPTQFFSASLDGQKLFDQKYAKSGLPEAVRHEGLTDLYAAIFPRIANLICAYPPALEKWQAEGYREEFRRFDEITATLSSIAGSITDIASQGAVQSDSLQQRLRHSLKQRVQFSLDLTGLRGDRPDAVPLEQCFVVPSLFFLNTIGANELAQRELRHLDTQVDIASTFNSSCRMILMGAPGSGKSSFCQWLQLVHLTNPALTTTFTIKLREIVREPALPSYIDLVRGAAGTHLKDEITAPAVAKWASSGDLLFLFDGLDEVPNDRRDEVVSWIKDLAEVTGKAGLAITSRPLTTDQLNTLGGWDQWQIEPFDEPRVVDYIERWYAHAPLLQNHKRDINARQLASVWLSDESLAPLAGSPLMLATLLMVHHLDGELPRGRSKVYERYVDGMLGLWDSRWGIAPNVELNTSEKKRLLTKIALHFHFNATEVIDDAQIALVVEPLIREAQLNLDAQLVLDHLRERSGLLVGPGMWSFVHKSVGEFLVACAVIDGDLVDPSEQRLDRLRLFKERFDDRWNTVIFFWAGLASPGDLQSFISEVTKSGGSKDFSLALGLIADQAQSHRLPKAWRAAQLQQLMKTPIEPEEATSTTLVTMPCLDSDITSWRIAFVEMRSISSEFFSFRWKGLWSIAAESDMEWSDVKDCHQDHRDALWINYMKSTRDINSLLSLLRDAKPWLTDIERITIAFSWGLPGVNSKARGISMTEFTDTFLNLFPEIRGRAPFFLMDELRRTDDPAQIQSIGALLSKIAISEIDASWLEGSGNFEEMGEESVSDVPAECRLHLQQLTPNTPAIAHALSYVDAAIARRVALNS